MQVKIFSALIEPGDTDFETEINDWLDENDGDVLSMTVSSSEKDGEISMVFFICYEEPDDDEGLPVTLPQITVRELSKLTPRLK